jgi:hypothetical protein
MLEFILKFLLLIVIGYWIYWLFIGQKKPSKAEKIRADYKYILDNKLPALGFGRDQIAEGSRGNIIAYKRGNLEVRLHSEPVFKFNRVEAMSGKTVTLQEHIDRLPPDMKKMITNSKDFDGTQLVTGTDFSLEVSDSEDAKRNFIETLEKWLAENQ